MAKCLCQLEIGIGKELIDVTAYAAVTYVSTLPLCHVFAHLEMWMS